MESASTETFKIGTTPTMTTCQTRAIEALDLPSRPNVFVTGGAGVGKSYLIRHYQRGLDYREYPILASTGAAAVLVGGRTFH